VGALTGETIVVSRFENTILHALVSLAAILAVAGCQIAPTHKAPPAGSYTAGLRQLEIDDQQTSVQGASVTVDFFSGAQPLLGRFFVEPDHASSVPVVVLSHELWAKHFGSLPGIIGQRIQLDGRSATVVGIAPPGFSFPEGTLLWTPRPARAR
jgi:hypothetical protein